MLLGIVEFFTSPEAIEILTKIIIAFILSGIIGVERELINKPAGIKTHTLVCISATLVMSLGIYLAKEFGDLTDPSRLPAQILAGIGFVGAGTIIRDGFSVKGITTAASLLAITCIGLAIGAGYFEAAVLASAVIFLILSLTTPLQWLFDKNRKLIVFSITTIKHSGMIAEIEEVFENNHIEIKNIKQINDSHSQYTLLKILVKCEHVKVKEALIRELCHLKNIKEVYTSKKSYKHEEID